MHDDRKVKVHCIYKAKALVMQAVQAANAGVRKSPGVASAFYEKCASITNMALI